MTGPPFREPVLPDVSTGWLLIRGANPEWGSAANARVRHDWCEMSRIWRDRLLGAAAGATITTAGLLFIPATTAAASLVLRG